jgi:hypothetical protein
MSVKFENKAYRPASEGPATIATTSEPCASTDHMINDAVVVGDLSSDVAQAVLNSEVVCGYAATAPRVPKDRWFEQCLTWKGLLDGPLTQHPVHSHKEGPAVFFYEADLTGHSSQLKGTTTRYMYRGKAHVKAVTAYVLDIDGTDDINRVRDQLAELGLFAVLYTTHSHAKKATDNGDYFRVIIPLDRPFTVAENGGTPNEAAKKWQSRYLGFAKKLGITDADPSAANFAQMMYLPRRASQDASFKHYIIAGRALRIDEMSSSKAEPTIRDSAASSGVPEGPSAILSDGFDLQAWFGDYGSHFEIVEFLRTIDWDIRNEQAGDGITIMCANHAEHSEPDDGTDQAAWCKPGNLEGGFVLTCRHAHCADLHTWHFFKLIEDRIADGEAALPADYGALSDLICSPDFYKDLPSSSGMPLASTYRVKRSGALRPLSTPRQVEVAFETLKANSNRGEDDYVNIFAGLQIAGNKQLAVQRFDELLKSNGELNPNIIARLRKQGLTLAERHRKSFARKQEALLKKKLQAATAEASELAHPSMDIAAPLGETMEQAIATLNQRWRPVSMGGSFRVLRVPDPQDLSLGKAAIETMSRSDFIAYHKNRVVFDGDKLTNPAEVFLNVAERASSIEFAPPPATIPTSCHNLYQGREIKAVQGSCEHLRQFIRHTVCRDREEIYRFVWLYLAHLVQRPGEKPMTAIVLRGDGGCGKSTFGEILKRLAAPYSLEIAEEEHVTGRFAGQHLATSLVAVCTEALFAGDPKVNGKIKNLVTAPTILVEPKGFPAVQMKSFTRFFFDSNNERVVPIDGNGSERRYLVLEVNDDYKNDADYFTGIYGEIDGQGIAALMWELKNYDPATDQLSWADLRTAPGTPERRKMRWHSMRPAERALIQIFEDGEVTLKDENGDGRFYRFKEGAPIRLPQAELRRHLTPFINKYDGRDGDIVKLMEDLFGMSVVDQDGRERAVAKVLRGKVEDWDVNATEDEHNNVRQNVRCFEFPPIELLQAVIRNRYRREIVEEIADEPDDTY